LDDHEVKKLWEGNADAWTLLSRQGYNTSREHLNTPWFLAMLPDVSGLRGLDIGCGEGVETRLLARRGATMIGIDLSQKFVSHAAEAGAPVGIRYVNASGSALPFVAESFDFVVACMSLMDMADRDGAVREAYRVLKPGGFFQFSITHPCFQTPRWKWVLGDRGERVAVECGDYFAEPQGVVQEWIFGAAPPEARERLESFRIPAFYRTLSSWVTLLLDTGFSLERLEEPVPDDETLAKHPEFYDTRIVAYFLHMRWRKPPETPHRGLTDRIPGNTVISKNRRAP
jgi:ubiquinone/menaquinone biosynthesis C-methylase UbiE